MSDTTIYWALYVTAGVTVAEVYLYMLRKQIEKYQRATIVVGYALIILGWPACALAMATCLVIGFVNGIKKAIK